MHSTEYEIVAYMYVNSRQTITHVDTRGQLVFTYHVFVRLFDTFMWE